RGARNGMGVDLVPDIQRPRQRLKPFAGTAPSANSKVGKSVHSDTARYALSAQTARSRLKGSLRERKKCHSPRRERSDAKGLLPGPLFGYLRPLVRVSIATARADTRPVRAQKTGAVISPVVEPTWIALELSAHNHAGVSCRTGITKDKRRSTPVFHLSSERLSKDTNDALFDTLLEGLVLCSRCATVLNGMVHGAQRNLQAFPFRGRLDAGRVSVS
ncbi:MAG: hypothetical protein WA156_05860, partial [Methylocystis silviterrae]